VWLNGFGKEGDKVEQQSLNAAFLENLFAHAVQAVHPAACLAAHLPTKAIAGRTIILAAGKAAASMAQVAAATLNGPVEGLVVTRHGHALDGLPQTFEVIEAGHPVPDEMSLAAAPKMLALAESATDGDRVIALISGGASSLLAAPVDEITFAQKQQVTKFLLRSGAPIAEINCVRKHLSKIKGGRLARAVMPASLYSFIISDVPGDFKGDVASGPTEPDASSMRDAEDILRKYHWNGDGAIVAALRNQTNESLFPGDAAFEKCHTEVIAKASDALVAAADMARQKGWQPVVLGDDLEGSAHKLGAEHARLALEYRSKGGQWALISGGETTVEVRNHRGRGGRNLEYLTGLAIALKGAEGISALACDTDGIDGTEDVAGAILGSDFIRLCQSEGISAENYLTDNNTYELFRRIGGLVKTGPTLTNVNDFRVILVEG